MSSAGKMSVFIVILVLLFSISAHTETWKELLDEAETLHKVGELDSAIVVASKALTEAQRARGELDTCVARILHRMGFFCHKERRQKAEDYYLRALNIWQTVPVSQPVNLAKTLNNLGDLSMAQARYLEAEAYFKHALEIKKKHLPENHPSTASTLNNLGHLFMKMGDYVRAEEYLLEGLKIRRICLSPDDPRLAYSINRVAMLYYYENRLTDAEPLFAEALELSRAAGNPEWQLSYIGYMGNLAALYIEKGDYVKAESLCLKGLDMMDTLALPTNLLRSQFLKNLGLTYRGMNRLKDAARCHLEDEAVSLEFYGPHHPEYLRSVYNLANIYRDLWKLEAADSLYRKLLAAREQLLGQHHPDVANTLYSMCRLKLCQGEYRTGLSLAKPCFNIRSSNFSEVAKVLSENDALRYCNQMRASGMLYLSSFMLLDSFDSSTFTEAADIYFTIKGTVSDEIFQRHELVVSETDSLIQWKAAQYKEIRAELANRYVKGTGRLDSTNYRRQLDSLSLLADQLELELAKQCADFRPPEAGGYVETSDLVSALPPKTCLVEFLRTTITAPDYRQSYEAYLALVADNERLRDILVLGPADKIDSIAALYRKHMAKVAAQDHLPTRADLEEYDSISRELYRVVWQPFEFHLSGHEMIIIAPDGALNLVSFAGLIDPHGRYLTETTTIHYLVTGRDLIRLKQMTPLSNGLLALGDPDYDATPAERIVASAHAYHQTQRRQGQPVSVSRGIRLGCGSISDITVPPLEGSRWEIDEIVKNWPVKSAGPVVTLLDSDASEDNLKREATGKRVVHLATHGFHIKSECHKDEMDAELIVDTERIVENPLLYSGLFLAGGNLHGQGCDSADIEDGILTAEEVSALNLRGTQLVVLSACESGLGDVQLGEGVYGLRRAFQLAGARTVVSALWPVSDKTTAEMMSQLYAESEKPLPKRIRDMQLAQIKKLRSGGFSDHPYNWAAFIALGDWR